MMTPAEHNAPEYLAVRWCEAHAVNTVAPRPAGWYVVRTCPCHFNERVSRSPFETLEKAERSRRAMLACPPHLANS